MLCSDGVFEKLTPQQAMDIALENWDDARDAALAVVRKCSNLACEDNHTCMVIQFGFNDSVAPEIVAQRKLKQSGGALKPQAEEPEDFDMFAD